MFAQFDTRVFFHKKVKKTKYRYSILHVNELVNTIYIDNPLEDVYCIKYQTNI